MVGTSLVVKDETDTHIIGTGIDISDGGMQIITTEEFTLNEETTICVHLPKGYPVKKLVLEVIPKWRKLEEEAYVCFGMQFKKLTYSQKIIINRLLINFGHLNVEKVAKKNP